MATNVELRAAADAYRDLSADIADAMEGFCSPTELTTLLYRLADITRPMQSHILATVPADDDDDEPVTVERLEAWGGESCDFGAVGARWFYRDYALSIIAVNVEDGWKVCVAHSPHAWTDIVRQRNTVGQMRQTLEGLGIALKGGA